MPGGRLAVDNTGGRVKKCDQCMSPSDATVTGYEQNRIAAAHAMPASMVTSSKPVDINAIEAALKPAPP